MPVDVVEDPTGKAIWSNQMTQTLNMHSAIPMNHKRISCFMSLDRRSHPPVRVRVIF